MDPSKVTERIVTSIGSGFIIDTKGIVLTNSHVAYGSGAILATLDSGQVKVAGQELLFGGDIIVSANGKSLSSPAAYQEFVNSVKVGDSVKLTIHRDGKNHKVEWILPERYSGRYSRA